MTKTKIILSVAVVVVTAFAVVAYEGPLHSLMERFPDVDPKITRKAHREMFKESFQGKYDWIDKTDATDDLDRIFLAKVKILTSK